MKKLRNLKYVFKCVIWMVDDFFFILKHCFCPKVELTHLFFKVRSLIFKNALYRGGGYKDYDCTLSTSGCWDPPPPYKSINASILNRYIKACGFHTYNMKILFYLDSLRAKMHIKLLRFGLLWWYSIPFFLSHRLSVDECHDNL